MAERVPKAVIFDYGGVLSTTPFLGVGAFERERGYPQGSIVRLLFGGSPPQGAVSARDTAQQAYDTRPVGDEVPDWQLLETGQLSLDEFHGRISSRAPEQLGAPLDGEFFERFLETLFVAIHWTVVERVRQLRADGYRLAILTNNVREWSSFWRESIPVDLFDVVVDSCEVALRKPDPAIFRLVCERLGVEPDEAVFLDDSPGHIESAREVGLRTILFQEPDQAMADLDALLDGRSTWSRTDR